MKKGTLIWGILACALLAFALTECDMSGSSTSALNSAPCDAGADATCPVITPDPPPSGGW